MRALTDHEKRTIRLAVAGIAIYLVLFFGFRGWRALESRRLDYQRLAAEAQQFKRQFQYYENTILALEKLKTASRLEPSKLSRATVVAEASAAIQKAATGGGVQLGPLRETPPRASAKELSAIQFECVGQAKAIITLLHHLETLGYPLIIDSVQLTVEASKPGMVKVNLAIFILDFDQWKKEARHA